MQTIKLLGGPEHGKSIPLGNLNPDNPYFTVMAPLVPLRMLEPAEPMPDIKVITIDYRIVHRNPYAAEVVNNDWYLTLMHLYYEAAQELAILKAKGANHD